MKKFIKKLLLNGGYHIVSDSIMKKMVHIDHLGLANVDCHFVLKNMIEPTSFTCCFDIGANIGQTAKKLIEYYPNATIHCFEPVASTFDILSRNFSLEKRIRLHHMALGDAISDTSVIYHQENSQWNSLSPQINQGGTSEVISVTTLDAFCEELKIQHINLLKIDTEGFEKQVFAGATDVLSKKMIDAIYVEVGFWENDKHHTNFYELSEILCKHDFMFSGLFEASYGGTPLAIGYANALYVAKKLYA